MTIRRLLTALCLVVVLAGLASGSSGAATKTAATGPVVVVHFNANIDELGSRYLSGALHHAANENAEVVVIQFNTLGGAITSMQSMVGDIFASPVPVVVWVGPAGAGGVHGLGPGAGDESLSVELRQQSTKRRNLEVGDAEPHGLLGRIGLGLENGRLQRPNGAVAAGRDRAHQCGHELGRLLGLGRAQVLPL